MLSCLMASMICCDFVCVRVHGMWIADGKLHTSKESPLLFRPKNLSHRGAKSPTVLLPVTGFVTSFGAVARDLSTTLSGVPIPYEASGWQTICNRRRPEASCHLLARYTWCLFLYTRMQALVHGSANYKCQWWLHGDVIRSTVKSVSWKLV